VVNITIIYSYSEKYPFYISNVGQIKRKTIVDDMHSVQKEIGRLNSKYHLLTKYFEIIVLDLLSGVFQKFIRGKCT